MTSQGGLAYQRYSSNPAQPTSNYYQMAPSSYEPRNGSTSTQDMASLTQHFGQQSLHYDTRNTSTGYHHTTAYSGPYNQQLPQTHATSSTHHTTLPSHQPSSSRSIPQCHAGHDLSLPSGVEHMIATGQCAICNTTAPSSTQQSEAWEDETIDEEDNFEDEGFEEPPSLPARLTYRRSTDLTGGQGYVSKAIRVRRKHRSDASRLR